MKRTNCGMKPNFPQFNFNFHSSSSQIIRLEDQISTLTLQQSSPSAIESNLQEQIANLEKTIASQRLELAENSNLAALNSQLLDEQTTECKTLRQDIERYKVEAQLASTRLRNAEDRLAADGPADSSDVMEKMREQVAARESTVKKHTEELKDLKSRVLQTRKQLDDEQMAISVAFHNECLNISKIYMEQRMYESGLAPSPPPPASPDESPLQRAKVPWWRRLRRNDAGDSSSISTASMFRNASMFGVRNTSVYSSLREKRSASGSSLVTKMPPSLD